MHRTTTAHRHASILLVLALLAGMTIPTPAAAAQATTRLTDGSSTGPGRINRWLVGRSVDEHLLGQRGGAVGFVPVWRFEMRLEAHEVIFATRIEEATRAARAAAVEAAAKAAAATKAQATLAPVSRNHLWIPSLGLSRSIEAFACTRAAPPTNRVYRWGCAGRNNVYLFGHAWGVMKPLHDGYVAGRVKIGMVARYADANGTVRTYRVTEIRIVTPDQVAWAIADQPVASMTFQTCIGASSDRRLLVRLVADR